MSAIESIEKEAEQLFLELVSLTKSPRPWEVIEELKTMGKDKSSISAKLLSFIGRMSIRSDSLLDEAEEYLSSEDNPYEFDGWLSHVITRYLVDTCPRFAPQIRNNFEDALREIKNNLEQLMLREALDAYLCQLRDSEPGDASQKYLWESFIDTFHNPKCDTQKKIAKFFITRLTHLAVERGDVDLLRGLTNVTDEYFNGLSESPNKLNELVYQILYWFEAIEEQLGYAPSRAEMREFITTIEPDVKGADATWTKAYERSGCFGSKRRGKRNKDGIIKLANEVNRNRR